MPCLVRKFVVLFTAEDGKHVAVCLARVGVAAVGGRLAALPFVEEVVAREHLVRRA